MLEKKDIQETASAAIPIVLGYIAIGIPCGILSASVGMNMMQVIFLCLFFYSGAGQYMIPGMWAAGAPIASIILSVSLVNSRHILYSASLAQYVDKVKKRLMFLFSATITDETFGVSTAKFEQGRWTVSKATLLNLISQTTWLLSNVIGVLVGSVLGVPIAIASFAMTSIFICLLVMQKGTEGNMVAALVAVAGVVLAKYIGLTGPAIIIGALLGVAFATVQAMMKVKK